MLIKITMVRKAGAALAIPVALAVAMLSAACAQVSGGTAAPSSTALPTRSGALTPYQSATAAVTVPVLPTVTPSPPPTMTPTPLTHVVEQGEDMSGIALRYGVDLAELIKANPTVNPRLMSVGTLLVIPAALTPQPTSGADAASPMGTPTPIPVASGEVSCMAASDGGIWCFQLYTNEQEAPVESVQAEMRLTSASGETLSQAAALPLDLLPPGRSLPLMAYFSPEDAQKLTGEYQAEAKMLSALPNRDDGRYLRCSAQQPKVIVSEDGLSAEVSLQARVDQPASAARRIWVVAVAYGADGKVVGVRRWEKPDDEPIATGESAPVSMRIYSAAGEIATVDLLVECRPSAQVRR